MSKPDEIGQAWLRETYHIRPDKSGKGWIKYRKEDDMTFQVRKDASTHLGPNRARLHIPHYTLERYGPKASQRLKIYFFVD